MGILKTAISGTALVLLIFAVPPGSSKAADPACRNTHPEVGRVLSVAPHPFVVRRGGHQVELASGDAVCQGDVIVASDAGGKILLDDQGALDVPPEHDLDIAAFIDAPVRGRQFTRAGIKGHDARGSLPSPEITSEEVAQVIAASPRPCGQDDPAGCSTRRFTFVSIPEEPSAHQSGRRARHAVASSRRGPNHVSARDIRVTFAVASAELTPQARINLRAVAGALNSPMFADLKFEIAAHTDALGAPDRNQALSERRAEAVRAFLVSLGVSPERLTAKGYGSQHLLDPNQPTSAANRRVEIQRLN